MDNDNNEGQDYKPPEFSVIKIDDIIKKLGPSISCSAFEFQGE